MGGGGDDGIERREMIYAAHRGGGGEFGPENTMYSYRKCLLHRVQMLEIDIKMTRDGHLVMMHDTTVERTTDGNGFLSSYSLKDVRKLDAAFYYPELRGQGIKVPTLREFLYEFTPLPDLTFMFDFRDRETVVKTMEIIKEYGPSLEGRFVMCSAFEDVNLLLCQLCIESGIPVTTHMNQSMRMTLSHNTPLLKYNFPCQQKIYVFILL